MTSMFTARRRTEEFAAAVDGSSEGGGADAELAAFVAIVSSLRHSDAAPRPAFAVDLRERLMTEAETVLSRQDAMLLLPVRQRGPRERRLVAAASAFVLIGGTATMAAAAQSSLPGEALYPIKRGIERAEAGLSLSDAGKGHDLLAQADSRLSEVDGLLEGNAALSTPRVAQTLAAFAAQADEGSDLLFASFERSQDPGSVIAVRSFATNAMDRLAGLAGVVPAGAQDELATAADVLRGIDEQATDACSACMPEVPAVGIPDMLLMRAEVDRALARVTVDPRPLDNSHPVEVRKGTVRTNDAPAANGDPRNNAPRAADPANPSVGSTPPPANQGPTDAKTPDVVPKLPLPGTEGSVGGGDRGKDNDPRGATNEGKKLVDRVTDPVETLLPDPTEPQ